MRGQITELDAIVSDSGDVGGAAGLLETRRQVVGDAEAQIKANELVFETLARPVDERETLKDSMLEMTRLEERLQEIIETCSALVNRLQREERPARDRSSAVEAT